MSMEDRPQVALVTGAVGGIGSATVRQLVARGYNVVAEDISAAVNALESDTIAVLQGDVADSATAARAVELSIARFGRLDVLVNNAARFLRKPTEETTDEDWDGLMATNLRGPFVHTRAALPALAATKGAIVNVTSIAGLIGQPGVTAYAATKGAIAQLTRQLAVEHAPRGIRVNAVAPGAVDTAFTTAFPRRSGLDPEAAREAMLASYPLGRVSSADEVAEAICFLASPAARAITGAVLPVDGGYTAR